MRTRRTIRELRALQLPQLLRNIQRVRAPPLAVEQVVLRRELDQLAQVLPARRGRDTVRAGAPVRGVSGDDMLPRARAAVGRVFGRGVLHVLNERRDGVLRRLFPEREPLHVRGGEGVGERDAGGWRGVWVEWVARGGLEYLCEAVPGQLVECGGEELVGSYLACEIDYGLRVLGVSGGS